MMFRRIYYYLKPLIPRHVQIRARQLFISQKARRVTDKWPIDPRAKAKPEGWTGWPGGKKFVVVITHDVDTAKGHERCLDLMNLEKRLGIRSSFNFVPKRYEVSEELRKTLQLNGFEVGVHGLNHDGRLYFSREIFSQRAREINRYLKEWGAVGFRSPSMHHELEWIHDLDITYDCSTFDTDPFEPQSDGMGTIFPFVVKREYDGKSYIELPYTLPQDFTLYVLLKEADPEIWYKKLDWIAEQNGMVLLNVHPDYLDFNGNAGLEEYSYRIYEDFLSYLTKKYENQYWHVLPKELARYIMEDPGKR